jgi:Tfp pilus assembly protein PilX
MKAGRFNPHRIVRPHSQRGVVLLIALIILVAMTLAGIGMMRSIDTGSVIAGNMAFKQATLNASDAGTNAGFNALATYSNTSNLTDETILYYNGNNTQLCPVNASAALCTVGNNINFPGYSSTPIFPCEVTKTCALASNYTWWTVDANWNGAPSVTVTDPNGGTIATVSYLIHRMCTAANTAPTITLTGTQLCQSYSQTQVCHTPPCPPPI